MKKPVVSLTLIAVAGISGLLASCELFKGDPLPTEPVPVDLTLKQKEVVASANKFAFDLFVPIVTGEDGAGNIMISPFSITSALSMTLNGAAGETFDAMKNTLCYGDQTIEEINDTYLKLMTDMVPVDQRVTMEIANSVWVRENLDVVPDFITTIEKWYLAQSESFNPADPGAADMVNGWIAEKTHDKIQKMLDSMDPDIAMLLINAIYFKGKWSSEFDKDDTETLPFYVTPGSPVQVPMMKQTNDFAVADAGNATLVELPYGQGNYSMVVMLPDEGFTVADAAAILTRENWDTWMTVLKTGITEVDLTMPRFKYEYKRTLNDDLKALGMEIAFDPLNADFSNMCYHQLVISFVLHQTFIETNEEGTEAAAATVVAMTDSAMPEITTINLNRPFLYFIRETTTGTIVFMGQVADPR
jgi:serpin B